MKSLVHYPQEMRHNTRPARSVEHSWWLVPHYVGCDAVMVAVIWQAVAARCIRTTNTWAEVLALALSVFCIYTGDRLRDSYFMDDRAQPRHVFMRRYRKGLAFAFFVALVLGGSVAMLLLPSALLFAGLLLCPVVALYFLWTHARGEFTERGWSKECAVGLVFATGVFLAPVLQCGAIHSSTIKMALAFASLCALNCLTIAYHESRSRTLKPYWLAATLAILIQLALWASMPLGGNFFKAVLLGSALLLLTMSARQSIQSDAVATISDGALICAGLIAWLL